MTQRLTPGTALLLTIPPLLWAGNAVVGRMAQGLIPPVTLNFLRWALAFAILLPLAGWVLRRSSGLWSHWRRFALLGLLVLALWALVHTRDDGSVAGAYCWACSAWAATTRCSTWR